MNVHFNNINSTQSSSRTVGLQVLVFKTNLRLKKDLRQVSAVLNSEPGILKWNVDQADVDKVLRIETTKLTEEDVITLVTGAGFCCEALPD